MHSLTVISHVNASPDSVWETIGNPSAIDSWHPVIAKSEVSGSERLCVLVDGAEVHERIESVDNDSKSYVYSITESPLPLASYRSTIQVQAEGDGSIVTWGAQFEPKGASAEEVAGILTGVYQAGLTALRTSV